MICQSCQKEIPQGSPRCPACGWIPPAPSNQWSSRPPGWMWFGFGCGALGCLGCLGLLAFIAVLIVANS
jgi:hypothetical protein